MKKKIEQLLNGKFEYEQPQLLFSKEKISLTMKAGETKRGEVYVGTEDNQKIRGYVTSSSRRVVSRFPAAGLMIKMWRMTDAPFFPCPAAADGRTCIVTGT